MLGKVARWDPDKRWMLAVETVGEIKRRGWRPLLIARGGVEAHGREVLGACSSIAAKVVCAVCCRPCAMPTLELNGQVLFRGGCSGEDYAVAGQNALVLEIADPREFISLFFYTWSDIVTRDLLPRIRHLAAHLEHLWNTPAKSDWGSRRRA